MAKKTSKSGSKRRTVAKKSNTTDKIIAAAETRMRAGGFHGFSFREIAADVGIKSASVHHHFPTKEDLAVAAVRSYADREMAVLGDPLDVDRTPGELMAGYIGLFRGAFRDVHAMCLCGLLASEAANLPSRVNAQVHRFFDLNLKWLEAVIKRSTPSMRPRDRKARALMITATLEGALLGAHCYRDIDRFESVVRELNKTLSHRPGKKT